MVDSAGEYYFLLLLLNLMVTRIAQGDSQFLRNCNFSDDCIFWIDSLDADCRSKEGN